MGKAKHHPWFWLAVIVVIGAAFRLYEIGHVRWNIDEGFWTYGSAMAAKQGEWWPEGWRQGFLSPLYTRLLYPFFLIFGHSIPVARYLSITLGLVSVLTLYFLCLRIGYGRRVALLSSAFLSLNGYFAFMNRHAQTDNLLVALIVGYLLLATGGKWAARVAPVLLASAMLTKLTGVFAAGAMYFYGTFVSYRDSSPAKRWLLPVLAPAVGGLLAGAVFFAIYAAQPATFVKTWQLEFFIRKSQSAVGFNPMAPEGLIYSLKTLGIAMPLTMLLGSVGMAGMLRERSKQHLLPLLWLVLGFLVIGFQNYQPPRFHLPLIPPLSIMSAWLISEMWIASKRRGVRAIGLAAAVLLCIYGPATWCVFMRSHRDTTGPDVTRWVNANLTPDTGVMGITPYGVSTNVRYCPQEILNQDAFLDDEEADRMGIDYILFDDTEWRQYARRLSPEFESHLKRNHEFVKRIGTVEIWKIRR